MHIKFDFGTLVVLLSVVAVFLVGVMAGFGSAYAAETDISSLSAWISELEHEGNYVEVMDIGFPLNYDFFEIVDTYVGGSFDIPFDWYDYTYLEDLVTSYDAQSACILAVNDGYSVDNTYYLLVLYDSPLTYVYIYITIEDDQYHIVAQGSKVDVPDAIVTSEFYTEYDEEHIVVSLYSISRVYGGYYSEFVPYWTTGLLSWLFGSSPASGDVIFYGFEGSVSSPSLYLKHLHTVHFDSSLAGSAAPTETPTVLPTPSEIPTVLPTAGMFDPIDFPTNPDMIPTFAPLDDIVIPTISVPEIPDNDLTRGLFTGYKGFIDGTIGFVVTKLDEYEGSIINTGESVVVYIEQVTSYVSQVSAPFATLMSFVFRFIPSFVWIFMGILAGIALILVVVRVLTHGFKDSFWHLLGGGK